MSIDQFYFPTPASLREENETLYYDLLSFIRSLPGGPWKYNEGYDPSGDGTHYSFTVVDAIRHKDEMGIDATKSGPHFSFMIVSKSNE